MCPSRVASDLFDPSQHLHWLLQRGEGRDWSRLWSPAVLPSVVSTLWWIDPSMKQSFRHVKQWESVVVSRESNVIAREREGKLFNKLESADEHWQDSVLCLDWIRIESSIRRTHHRREKQLGALAWLLSDRSFDQGENHRPLSLWIGASIEPERFFDE